MKHQLLVTGSSGLIGSEVVAHFHGLGWSVTGFDNNMRRDFFGAEGDTTWNERRLIRNFPNFRHMAVDIRDRQAVQEQVKSLNPDLVVHAAAQPSHDLAARRPFDDFDVNAVGTLNLLESVRRYCPEAVFVYMSTNKVYGDRPNTLPMRELETRWDYASQDDYEGVTEQMSIDQSKHSIFGASKVAADVMVQEYGRYFGIRTCCLRGGCLTGPSHSGVELHGFLSFLVKCNLTQREYTVYGYKGKQVRDNIHAHDVARCIEFFFRSPSAGAVFNLGGGRANSISILEAFARTSELTSIPMRWKYEEKAREGDHICYISDLRRVKEALPGWEITRSLEQILREIVESWRQRTA